MDYSVYALRSLKDGRLYIGFSQNPQESANSTIAECAVPPEIEDPLSLFIPNFVRLD